MKGMEKKYFGTRHFIEKGFIYLQKIGTLSQIADIGTKALNKTIFVQFRNAYLVGDTAPKLKKSRIY